MEVISTITATTLLKKKYTNYCVVLTCCEKSIAIY